MVAQKKDPTNETKGESKSETRRRRRHWYDHEKVRIINAYDAGQLESVYSKPNLVVDPKSKEQLSIFLIEGWKDQFRTLGILKATKQAPKAVQQDVQKMPQSADAVQTLLVNVLLENQKLKAVLEGLKKSGRKMENGDETQINL